MQSPCNTWELVKAFPAWRAAVLTFGIKLLGNQTVRQDWNEVSTVSDSVIFEVHTGFFFFVNVTPLNVYLFLQT